MTRSKFAQAIIAVSTRPPAIRYAGAVFAVLFAFLVTARIPNTETAPLFPLFTAAVLVSSLLAGYHAGILAVALSAFASYYLLAPRFTLAIANPTNLIRVALFAVIGLAINYLIKQLRAALISLEEQREFADTTLDSIGDGVLVTDVSGNVRFINLAGSEITGYSTAEAAGRSITEILPLFNEETGAPVANPVTRVLETGRVVGMANHTILRRRDGTEVPLDDSAAPIQSADGTRNYGVVMVFRDISERRRNEIAMRRAEKLAAAGRLSASLAHEINNPLEILTNLLYLLRSYELPNTAAAYAAAAEEEVARAAHLIRRTLAFHRESAQAGKLKLRDVVGSIAAVYEPRFKRSGVTFVNSIDDHATAWVKASDLHQVLSNLISNALDATAMGGTIKVETREAGQNSVELRVIDDGEGIRPDCLDKVFEPFFTTKKDTGTGLGLWITRELVESSGGRIAIESCADGDGHGTCVSVFLPRSEVIDQLSTAV